MQAVYSLPANLFGANGKLDYDVAIAFACSGDKTERHTKWSLLKRTLHQSLFEALKTEAARRRKLAAKKSSCKSVTPCTKQIKLGCEIQEIEDQMEFLTLKRRVVQMEMYILSLEANEHICPVG